MSFYLTAVKGDIPVHLLEVIAVQRLRYLKAIIKQEDLIYNEYVVEGSIYDNAGHFLLCILAIIHKNFEFTQFILNSERQLFKQRIDVLSPYNLRRFAKKLLQNIKKQGETPGFVDALKILCQHLMLKDLAHHVCSSSHNSDCKVHIFSVHFKHCLHLISKRQVELQNGQALLPCGKWKQFLILLFCTNLKYRLSTTKLETLKADPRILELLEKLKREIPFTTKNSNKNILLSKNVDSVSALFPPCMLNLHLHLRKQHRLSHMQRFYYSLFLKDIGMPVEEAVEFWRCEYQKNPSGSHSCCHSWDKDEKKFMYGIRHMYGLEGGRKNYSSVSCHQIQGLDNACSEGGCPFKIFEKSKMLQILGLNENDTLWSHLNELKARQQYTSACMKYLESKDLKIGNNCDIENLSFNFTPVKYYTEVSKSVTIL